MSNLGQLFDEEGGDGKYTVNNLTKAPGEQLYPKLTFGKIVDRKNEPRKGYVKQLLNNT